MQHTKEFHGANRPHEYNVHMIYDIQNKASKLAKTFRGHAKQRVMDAYLVVVTHGAVDMFVTFFPRTNHHTWFHEVERKSMHKAKP